MKDVVVRKIEQILRDKLNGRTLVVYGEDWLSELYLNIKQSLFERVELFVKIDYWSSSNPFRNIPAVRFEEANLSVDNHFVLMIARQSYVDQKHKLRELGFVEEDCIDMVDLENRLDEPIKYGLESDESPISFCDDSVHFTNSMRFQNSIGDNTGNLVHWHALKCSIPMKRYSRPLDESTRVVVTNSFICIRSNSRADIQVDNWRHLFELGAGVSLVPLFLGITYPKDVRIVDIELPPKVIKMLRDLSGISKLIGTRTEFAAEILMKYGIKNVVPMGCPSIYYPFISNRIDKIERSTGPLHAVVNSAHLGEKLSEKDWFNYISERNFPFVCQQFDKTENQYLTRNRQVFTRIDSWENYLEGFNFSIGMRFHGNIVPIWKGIPSLFIVHDSRTKGMCEFFSLPHIDVKDFDPSKPIEYYYDLADYSEFNRKMPKLVDDYKDFLKTNGIII